MNNWNIIEHKRLPTGAMLAIHHTEQSGYDKAHVEYHLETPLGAFVIKPMTVFGGMRETPEFLYPITLDVKSIDITDSLEEAKRVVKEYITNVISICNNQLRDLEGN